MRVLFVLGMALFVSACSSGGGSGQSMLTCTATDEFMIDKVQLNGPAALADKKTPVGSPVVQTRSRIPAGTPLTALVHNTCDKPGEITSSIARASEVNEIVGMRSYLYVPNRDLTRGELRKMAADDECLAGLADSTIDTVSALPSDPLVPEQSQWRALDGVDAYPLFYDSSLGRRRAVVIAVIDTGADIEHEDLRGALWVNTDEVAGNGVDDDQNGYVDDVNGYNFADGNGDPRPQGSWSGNYHGTHVAGLAGAKGNNGVGGSGIMGIGARIMVLNVFGGDAGAFNHNTENAIRYAADNGADVINLSIGGSSGSTSYRAAIEYAVSRGVSIFAAAGNENRQLGEEYAPMPGAYGPLIDGMLTVGSVDANDGGWSEFSNYGSTHVEIAAPGSHDSARDIGLLSTLPGNSYGRLQGTSMSTPIVSGAAALSIQLMRALGYKATPARVEAILKETARTSKSLVSRVGGGRQLNLKTLAEGIRRAYPPLATPEDGVNGNSDSLVPLLPCP